MIDRKVRRGEAENDDFPGNRNRYRLDEIQRNNKNRGQKCRSTKKFKTDRPVTMLLTNGSTNHNASNNWIDQSQCCYHPRGFHLVKKQILNVYNLFKDERFNEERLMCLCLVSNERFVSEPKFVFQFDCQCQTAIQIHVKLKNGHLGESQQ